MHFHTAKVLDAAGQGSESTVIAGIEFCVDNAAASTKPYVVNVSIGGEPCGDGSSALSQTVDAAVDAGLTVVVAAGNSGDDHCTVTAPGDAAQATTAGALTEYSGTPSEINASNGVNIAWFSSRGPTGSKGHSALLKPDVAAPGMTIMAAKANTGNNYHVLSGTSMATPFVASVAALMLDANPNLTPAEVKTILA